MALDAHEGYARGAEYFLGEAGAILTPHELGGGLVTEITDTFTDLVAYVRPTEELPSEEGGIPLTWFSPCPNKRCYHRVTIGQTQCFGCHTPIKDDTMMRSRSRSAAAN